MKSPLKENVDYEFIAVGEEENNWRVRFLTGPYPETIISFGKVTAFENQQRRTQLASQNLANVGRLGTGIGQMYGQFAPVSSGVTERDVSTLARIGATERGIGQAGRTADYQNLMRSYMQPFQAMDFQSGMIAGFPTAAAAAQQSYNPLLTGIQSLF